MPSIGQVPQATDFVKYFTTDFLRDLGEMAQLRDELEKRQGLMSVVESAHRDRSDAALELVKAKEIKGNADVAMADAKAAMQKATEKFNAAKARETALDTREAEFDKSVFARESAIDKREKAADAREQQQQHVDNDLAAKKAKLFADDAALQARIKAFQDKVAAISI
jgi:beta-galactosidase/beta-glucuronidase